MNDLYAAREVEDRDLTIGHLRARIAQLESDLAKAQNYEDQHFKRCQQLEAALDDIASRTDYTRDDCGKRAADALALETLVNHSGSDIEGARQPRIDILNEPFCVECGCLLSVGHDPDCPQANRRAK